MTGTELRTAVAEWLTALDVTGLTSIRRVKPQQWPADDWQFVEPDGEDPGRLWAAACYVLLSAGSSIPTAADQSAPHRMRTRTVEIVGQSRSRLRDADDNVDHVELVLEEIVAAVEADPTLGGRVWSAGIDGVTWDVDDEQFEGQTGTTWWVIGFTVAAPRNSSTPEPVYVPFTVSGETFVGGTPDSEGAVQLWQYTGVATNDGYEPSGIEVSGRDTSTYTITSDDTLGEGPFVVVWFTDFGVVAGQPFSASQGDVLTGLDLVL